MAGPKVIKEFIKRVGGFHPGWRYPGHRASTSPAGATMRTAPVASYVRFECWSSSAALLVERTAGGSMLGPWLICSHVSPEPTHQHGRGEGEKTYFVKAVVHHEQTQRNQRNGRDNRQHKQMIHRFLVRLVNGHPSWRPQTDTRGPWSICQRSPRPLVCSHPEGTA